MTPRAKNLGFPRQASSVLRFTHPGIGGRQMTSLIEGALGGWMLTLKALIIEKSCVEEDAVFKELL